MLNKYINMIDIYTRTPDEVNYVVDTFDVGDELQIHLQQILMLLKTDRGKIIGDESFGFNLDSLIFEQNLRESEIENQINQQINEYCSFNDKFDTKAKVSFFRGPTQDYGFIDILVDGEKYIGVLAS